MPPADSILLKALFWAGIQLYPVMKTADQSLHILVTGSGGQLGREIHRLSAAGCPRDRFLFSDVRTLQGEETLYLDITNPDAVSQVCASEGIDVIVNCAGYTDVERAESDAAAARQLNAGAPGTLAEVARKTGAFLIHISTDFVFDGKRSRPYTEVVPAAPLSVYGATKWEGEKAVLDSGLERYLILRTAWMYSPYGKNFVKTMLALTRERERLQVVSDQVGTPTAAADLAGFILDVIARRRFDVPGIYHYSDEGACSWYDFACAIRDLAGNTCEILPCRSEDYPAKAERPHYSVLDKTKVKKTFGITVPNWHDSLVACYQRILEHD